MFDNLQTVIEPDWAEVCSMCPDDIRQGDVVVHIAGRWLHEECASQQPATGMTRPPEVPAQYTANVRTRVVPDPRALAAIVPDCHIAAGGTELVSITYPAPTAEVAHIIALALAQTTRGQLGDVACSRRETP